MSRKSLHEHTGTALLRAAAAPRSHLPAWWPAPGDTDGCLKWLEHVWSRPGLTSPVQRANSELAIRVDAIRDGRAVSGKRVRRAAMATARYLLRATGRPTPFGLFAGVAPMALGPGTKVRWGGCHRAVAGLGRPAAPALSPALVEGDSIAYLTLERVATEDGTEPRFRLGAVGYGPASGVLAQRLCGQIRAWGGNRTVEPVISLYPAGTPDGQLATGYVIEKPSARMVITF